MFVGKINDRGNFVFETLDGKIVERFNLVGNNLQKSIVYLFEGFGPLISEDLIGDVEDLHRKSEDMTMDELFLYIAKKAGLLNN